MWYLLATLLIFTTILLLFFVMIHLGFRVPSNLEKTDPSKLGLVFQTVSIPTVSQKQLFGWLLPLPGATSTMVILHGWYLWKMH